MKPRTDKGNARDLARESARRTRLFKARHQKARPDPNDSILRCTSRLADMNVVLKTIFGSAELLGQIEPANIRDFMRFFSRAVEIVAQAGQEARKRNSRRALERDTK